MKIARLYLEDDDPMLAESFINRASLLQVIFIKLSSYCCHKNEYFYIFRLNLKMRNYKYVIKCATQGYWIIVASLLKQLKDIMSCPTDQLYQKKSVWLL